MPQPTLRRPGWGFAPVPWALAAAALLAACASPPPAGTAVQSRPASQVPAPLGGPSPAGPVSAPPAQPAAPPATAPAAAIEVPASTEAPALAARFPDPPVRYATPAFAAGRQAFTSSAEMQSMLRELARETPPPTRVQLLSPGLSQSGQPIEALLLTRLGDAASAALRSTARPTVMLIGQQHGDEPAGSEALLVLARQLAQGPLAPLLDRLNVLIVPRANPDGAQAGRRATASGLDANRDHLLLRTPEAQAMAALMRDYEPMVVADAHEYPAAGLYLDKFGAVARADVLLQYATAGNVHEFVTRAAEEWFRQPLLASLQREGLSSDWYHTLSGAADDRRVAMGGTRPDMGRNVSGLRHAVSLLIESRGVGLGRAHFARRVHTQVVAMTSVLQSAAARADDLVKLRRFVDSEVSRLACQGEVVVEAAATPSEYPLRLLDPLTGADKSVSVAWDSSLQLQVLKSRARPCGYWLAAGEREAMLRLRALGLSVQRVDANGVVRGETYRETSRATVPASDGPPGMADAGGVLLVQVEAVPALVDVSPGSWYVPLDQPLAYLAVAALEPDTPSSYVAGGVVSRVDNVARILARPAFKASAVP